MSKLGSHFLEIHEDSCQRFMFLRQCSATKQKIRDFYEAVCGQECDLTFLSDRSAFVT